MRRRCGRDAVPVTADRRAELSVEYGGVHAEPFRARDVLPSVFNIRMCSGTCHDRRGPAVVKARGAAVGMVRKDRELLKHESHT
jgi:hypothetical protein